MYTFSESSCILDLSKRRDVLGVSPNMTMIDGSHARVKVPHGSLVGIVCVLERGDCTGQVSICHRVPPPRCSQDPGQLGGCFGLDK
jgi:hypothetical protein